MTDGRPPATTLLFDLDGTLVDSRVVVERAWAGFADEHGLELEAILAVCHGRRSVDTIAEVAPGLDAVVEAERLDGAEENDIDGLAPVAGADALLRRIEPSTWAVVTSGHRSLATKRLAAVGLPAPPLMVCGDEIDRGKPDPEGFLQAIVALAADPAACIVLEDTPAGVEAGRRAGARVIALTTTMPASALGAADAVVSDLVEALAPLRDFGYPI